MKVVVDTNRPSVAAGRSVRRSCRAGDGRGCDDHRRSTDARGRG